MYTKVMFGILDWIILDITKEEKVFTLAHFAIFFIRWALRGVAIRVQTLLIHTVAPM